MVYKVELWYADAVSDSFLSLKEKNSKLKFTTMFNSITKVQLQNKSHKKRSTE